MSCVLVGAVLSAFFLYGSGLGLAMASVFAGLASTLASTLRHAQQAIFMAIGASSLLAAALLTCLLIASVALEQRRANLLRQPLENARRATIESMAARASRTRRRRLQRPCRSRAKRSKR